VLHPRHKLTYFRQMKWEESWIKTVIDVVRNEWDVNYKPKPTTTTSSSSATQKYFSNLYRSVDGSLKDALAEYLATPNLPHVDNPIVYWMSQTPEKNPLAAMALDFLTAPASSTNVECAFSSGGRQVSKLRHSLADETIRAVCVLGLWSDNGLVPHDELIENIRKKSRSKGKETAVPSETDIVLSSDSEP
ncbi:hypothetical protein JAAARDRAFT_141085, partial [Jaapia argillacea MUCL 33604]